jgi:membrane protease YdiL (CAAX protease family)
MTSTAADAPLEPASASSPGEVTRLRLWLGVTGLAALGLVLSAPFFLPVMKAALANRPPLPMPLWLALVLQDVQGLLLAALAAAVGVWTAGAVGLDAPLLRARLAGQRVARRLAGLLPDAILAGTLSAGAVLALSLAFKSQLPAGLGDFPEMSPWRTATAAAYGGLVEEILCRWGLLSLFAFCLNRLGVARGTGFWVANLAAALAFGALHLPAASQLGMRLTPLVVAYLLLGNGVVGVVCGWLFRRRGLESAMLAHGSADLWLHTVFPVLGL